MKIIFIKTEKGKQGESCYDQYINISNLFYIKQAFTPPISTDASQDLQNAIAER